MSHWAITVEFEGTFEEADAMLDALAETIVAQGRELDMWIEPMNGLD